MRLTGCPPPAWMKTTRDSSTLDHVLEALSLRLSRLSDTPQLDAQVILAKVLARPRTWVMAHPESGLDPGQASALEALIRRLEAGEPLPYVLERWEFFGLELEVTPDVLIPRPETELLVERAIAWLQDSPGRRSVADVGTGSGAIAVALAVHLPDLQVTATDISAEALVVARKNAARFQVMGQIEFLQCDLLPAKAASAFDLICANLPYIPTETLRGLPIYGREPSLALDGGADGLDPMRRLLAIAPAWLAPDGVLLLEVEATRGTPALSLAYDAFEKAEIHLHQDLAGRDRLLEIRLPGEMEAI
jgi:release factor glutamine methyltransferase